MAPGNEKIFAIFRQLDNNIALILLNFSKDEISFDIPPDDPVIHHLSHLKLALANYDVTAQSVTATSKLRPSESRVYLGTLDTASH